MDIASIKRQVSMNDVLCWYGWEGPSGRRGYNGWETTRCPFHDDSNPSARYNEDRDRFECFACDIKGDIIDVIASVEFMPTVEAMRWIEANFLN